MVRIALYMLLRLLFLERVTIGRHERGLLFRRAEFINALAPGRHWVFDPLGVTYVETVSVRKARFEHADLDIIARSGALSNEIAVHELSDDERGLVWREGCFDGVLMPGLHVYWLVFHKVEVEVVTVTRAAFEHPKLRTVLQAKTAQEAFTVYNVPPGSAGLLIEDGRITDVLPSGRYVYWKGAADRRCEVIDLREQTLDVSGQELMTADKVTLRLNAVVTFRVDDVRAMHGKASDPSMALYREAQLSLRALVGALPLDELLTDRSVLSEDLATRVQSRAKELGLHVTSAGIRDVILPGDMKVMLNRVMEARKAAEANVITRREETAAMRSQVNTAQLLEKHPTLMRMRELEVLTQISEQAKLNVILGEKGLAERVVNLL